jgi:hypothetical protein
MAEDFRKFLFAIWKHLRLPKPTKRQYEMAWFLQHGPDRLMLQAFRGIGKSWVTVAFVAWLLYNDPQLNITVISASKQKADDFTTFLLRLIQEVPFLKFLQPRGDQRCSKVAFDVGPARAKKDPSVSSIGITGQLTGGRADIIIPDDVEVPGNSDTQKMREKLAERIKECAALIKPGGRIIYLGTPQNESSIYNLLPKRGYTIRVWPSEYPNEKQRLCYGDRLAPALAEELEANPSLVGQPTDPQRFTAFDLASRRVEYGEAGYALQFMLDTSLADVDRYPLHLSDLVVAPVDLEVGPERYMWAAAPEYIINDLPCVGLDGDKFYRPMTIENVKLHAYQGRILVIDPAGRGKDETGYAVLFFLNGFIYLADAGGMKGYETETLTALANIAKQYKVNDILVEANFGDGMFNRLLGQVLFKVYPCTITEVKHSTQKERRICDTLEPVMSTHRLVVDPKVIRRDYESTQTLPVDSVMKYRLFYQMSHITRERGSLAHDDRLDAVAIGVNYFVEQMGLDVEEGIQRLRDDALQEELDNWHSGVLGHSVETHLTWM